MSDSSSEQNATLTMSGLNPRSLASWVRELDKLAPYEVFLALFAASAILAERETSVCPRCAQTHEFVTRDLRNLVRDFTAHLTGFAVILAPPCREETKL